MRTKWTLTMAYLGAGLACACGAGCDAILGLGDPTVTAEGGDEGGTSADGASPLEGGGAGDTGSHDGSLGNDTGGRDASVGDASVRDADGGPPSDGPAGEGSCAPGVCPPFALIAEDSGYSPRQMAQDDTYVYWTDIDHSYIGKTEKGSAKSTLLFQGSTQPEGIAVDDAGVFWGDNSPGVWRCPKAGCSGGRVLVSSTGYSAFEVAVDDRNVYWTEELAMAVRAAPKDGVDAGYSTVWQSSSVTPFHIATDGQRVYFTADDGKLYYANLGDGGVSSVGTANASGALGIALDNGAVYWTVADPTAGSINFASKSSLAPTPIASSQKRPADVASDGTSVYWVNFGSGTASDGTVFTCMLASCSTPTPLASNQADPRAILVDNAAVYWIDNGATAGVGSLWKVAK